MQEKNSSRLFIGNTLRKWHFQCTKIYGRSNDNFEIVSQMNIEGLYFENLKKIAVIGQKMNMGFYEKGRGIPQKNGQVVKPQGPTSLRRRITFCFEVISKRTPLDEILDPRLVHYYV